MKKHTWKTIAALTLTAGLMLQPVSAAYAAEGDWLVEEASEVLTEDNGSGDYGLADETEYACGTENDILEEAFAEGGDMLYSEEQAAADPFGNNESYVTEDGSLPAELWTDSTQNANNTADGVLFDELIVTENIVSEDTAAADESGNADIQEADVITEYLPSGTDELIGNSGQNLLVAEDAATADNSVVIEEELSLEDTAGIDGAPDNSKELFEKLAEIEFYGGVLEEQDESSAGELSTFCGSQLPERHQSGALQRQCYGTEEDFLRQQGIRCN